MGYFLNEFEISSLLQEAFDSIDNDNLQEARRIQRVLSGQKLSPNEKRLNSAERELDSRIKDYETHLEDELRCLFDSLNRYSEREQLNALKAFVGTFTLQSVRDLRRILEET